MRKLVKDQISRLKCGLWRPGLLAQESEKILGWDREHWAILILISDLQRKWIPPGRPVSSLSSLPLPLTRHINTHQTNYIHRTIHHAPVIPFYIVLLPLLPTCLTKQPQHRNHKVSFVIWADLIFVGLFNWHCYRSRNWINLWKGIPCWISVISRSHNIQNLENKIK